MLFNAHDGAAAHRTFRSDCLSELPILVTGASSGIGRQAAIAFAALGAKAILIGRDSERLKAAAAAAGPTAEIMEVDLADDEAASLCVRNAADRHGGLHGIFHCAGIGGVAPTRLLKRAYIDQVFGAAVFGAFGLARGASRKGAMRDGGSIAFMTSIMGKRGRQGLATYSAAKAAVAGLTRSLAVELAPRRIRVNSVAAGAVQTEMHEQVSENLSGSMMASYEALHPMGFGRVEDVVDAGVYLMSDASRWVTGIDLSVDGGYAAK
jgi:NAD(P)-dependent dehydrogenase (short-subunit alcohol dehydrogenase family)